MRKNLVNAGRAGFTLVELSLSIAFISILSIIIVIIINNTISSYHRGLTLNKINSTGMDLADDIRSAIQNSPGAAVTGLCDQYYKESTSVSSGYRKCHEKGARNFVSVMRLANVKDNHYNTTLSNVPVFGAFCTGYYSYIWNSGYFFSDGDFTVTDAYPAQLSYLDINGDEKVIGADNSKPFKLLKIEDDERAVCVSATFGANPGAGTDYYSVRSLEDKSESRVINDGNRTFDVRSYQRIQETPIDILADGVENNLAIYDFWSAIPAESKSNYGLFYVTSFVLGTTQGGINVNASGNFCATPGDYPMNEYLDYCAINKFNIASQAMGASR